MITTNKSTATSSNLRQRPTLNSSKNGPAEPKKSINEMIKDKILEKIKIETYKEQDDTNIEFILNDISYIIDIFDPITLTLFSKHKNIEKWCLLYSHSNTTNCSSNKTYIMIHLKTLLNLYSTSPNFKNMVTNPKTQRPINMETDLIFLGDKYINYSLNDTHPVIKMIQERKLNAEKAKNAEYKEAINYIGNIFCVIGGFGIMLKYLLDSIPIGNNLQNRNLTAYEIQLLESGKIQQFIVQIGAIGFIIVGMLIKAWAYNI